MIESIGSGDNFIRDAPARMSELIRAVNRLEAMQPGPGITIIDTGHGKIIQAVPVHIAAPAAPAAVAQSVYLGYFALRLLAEGDGDSVTYKVAIVDGATYDPEKTPVSMPSICLVNNVRYMIDPWQSGPLTDSCYILLKYTADLSNAVPSKAKIEAVTWPIATNIPDDTSSVVWFLLGRLLFGTNSNGTKSVQIAQDHTIGVAQLFWYSACYTE